MNLYYNPTHSELNLRFRIQHLEEELAKTKEELLKARIKAGQLAVEVMRKSAQLSEVEEKLKRWQTELEILADQKGHNLCWAGVPRLFKNTIGYTGKYPDPENVTREEFELGCRAYQDDIFGTTEQQTENKVPARKEIFLICPVRDVDEILKKLLSDYVEKLEVQGYKVHYPARDTEQNDLSGGYKLCQTNFQAILSADEVHIWYDESSSGSKFDMGGVFMLHSLGVRKKIVIANNGLILAESQQKSFLRVMRHLIQLYG